MTVGLVANFVFLLGCLSPSTQELGIFRVNVTVVANGLQKLANDTRDPSDLLSPDLPVYWYWGMSGICDVRQNKDETRCRRAFPPTQNILTIVEESLEGQAVGILAAWNATLSKIDPAKLRNKEGKVAAQIRGSAALAVMAVLSDFTIPPLALLAQEGSKWPYFLSLGPCALTIGAGALATLSVMDGLYGAIETGEREGPAIKVLFAGVALKFCIVVAAAYCSSTRGGKSDAETAIPLGQSGGQSVDQSGSFGPSGSVSASPFPSPEIPLRPRITETEEERAERRREIGFNGERYVSPLYHCPA
jgi:hypothetical protein